MCFVLSFAKNIVLATNRKYYMFLSNPKSAYDMEASYSYHIGIKELH